MSKRVYAGLSGGVDSALAVALLCEAGMDVHAVYMKNWSRDLPGFKCPWAEDLADAERIAVKLGCELEVWDCEAEYKKTVVDYLLDAYAHGYTPNPDVMCNQTIKFGSFARRAFAEGADFVATGHYGRVLMGKNGETELHRAVSEHKDQTYFLWRVPGDVFSRTLFPIGNITNKKTVRSMCAARGLGVEHKADSDGICFIGPVGIRTFLLDTLDKRPGDIVEWETGRALGRHDGAFLFTVGQRKGLNLGGGPARYVVACDTGKNIVYVTADRKSPALCTQRIDLGDCCWILGILPEAGEYVVRLRHTGELLSCRFEPGGDMTAVNEGATAQLFFDRPVERVAPGQSAVIYAGTRCLGGGIIQKDARFM